MKQNPMNRARRNENSDRRRHRSLWVFPVAAIAALLAGVPIAERALADGELPPGLQPTHVRVAVDPALRYGQPQLAINPTDPDNFVYHVGTATPLPGPFGALFDVETFVSFDRGINWQEADYPFLPPTGRPDLFTGGFSGLQAAPDGSFYTIWIAFNACPGFCPPYGLYGADWVTRSTDGGLTWSDTVLTGLPLDHPRLTVDQSTGVIYGVGGDEATRALSPTTTADPNQVFGGARDRFTRTSTDGVTWSEPSRPWTCPSPDDDDCQGDVYHHNYTWIYASAANGVLAGAFNSDDATRCADSAAGIPPCIVFQTSGDDGATWSSHVVPVRADTTGYRVPGVVADPSTPGRFALGVMNSNTAMTSFTPIRGTEFLVYVTEDYGATWSNGVVVSEDAGNTHEKPWMHFSRKGVLGVTWRTNQDGGMTDLSAYYPYNVWATISDDGGATFYEPIKVSPETSPAASPVTAPLDSMDCCSNIVVADEGQRAYVSWTDWSTGQGEGVMSTIKLQAFRFDPAN